MTSVTPHTTRSFRDLTAWQRSMDLAAWAHTLASQLPDRYRWTLGDQIIRAAVSVPSNIAKGSGRRGSREYAYHVGVARGSLRELETQLMLGLRIGLFRPGDLVEPLQMIEDIARMLTGLIKRLAPKP